MLTVVLISQLLSHLLVELYQGLVSLIFGLKARAQAVAFTLAVSAQIVSTAGDEGRQYISNARNNSLYNSVASI